MPRESFRDQIIVPADAEEGSAGGRGSGRRSSVLGNVRLASVTEDARKEFVADIDDAAQRVLAPFESKFAPGEMRQLALVAHNHMKPAMKEFIQTYSEILKKFRITGTQTTMRMCKTLWGEDNPEIEYGLTCTSGPLGGDAQIAALMCIEDLGALIFFVDPLSAHPHQADIDSLIRLTNCGNVVVCPNPTSAMSMMHTLKMALETGSRGMIPSFFETLESPAVAEYKRQQELALAAAVGAAAGGNAPLARSLNTDPSMFDLTGEQEGDEKEDDEWSVDGDDDEEVEEMVNQARRMSAMTLEESMGTPENGRGSTGVVNLYGLKQKKPQKKRDLMKKNLGKVKKSMRNVVSKMYSH